MAVLKSVDWINDEFEAGVIPAFFVFGYEKSVRYGGPLRAYPSSRLDWDEGLKPGVVFIVSTHSVSDSSEWIIFIFNKS